MITYNKNTTDTVSNMPVNQSKTHGTNITLSNSTPTRTGYTFDGWYEYSSCTGTMYSQGGNYTNNSNVTLYAKWKINSHVITFNANGGKFSNGTDTFKITQNYGTSITKPADPTRIGHTFKGWDKEVPSTMPDQDITITAKEWQINQYTITFDTKGGSTISPITQNYGTSITKPANPTKTGYTFAGWDKTIPSTMPAQSMTITAKNWTPKTVKVTFNRNTSSSDTTTLSQTFTYAASGNKFGYNTNGNPTWAQTGQFGGWDRTGYKLLGWSTDKNATTATYSVYSGVNDSWINSNSPSVTLYAIWQINQYTITFDTKGGSTISPITQNYGTSITKPANPTKTGYTFTGWDKTIPSTMPAQSMTVIAQWKIIDKPVYIYYNPNSGTVGGTYKTYNGWVSSNGSSYFRQTVQKGDSTDLYNYETFSITRSGYKVYGGNEWCINISSQPTCFNQDTKYTYNDYKSFATEKTDHYELNLYLNWQQLVTCCWYDSIKHGGAGCGGTDQKWVRDGSNAFCYWYNQTSCPANWAPLETQGCYNFFEHQYAPITGGDGGKCKCILYKVITGVGRICDGCDCVPC